LRNCKILFFNKEQMMDRNMSSHSFSCMLCSKT
jgi:hypothetical protein